MCFFDPLLQKIVGNLYTVRPPFKLGFGQRRKIAHQPVPNRLLMAPGPITQAGTTPPASAENQVACSGGLRKFGKCCIVIRNRDGLEGLG